MDSTFDWVPFYKELAEKLLPFRNDRQELIRRIRQIYATVGIGLPTLEKGNKIVDMCPFTFFGLFNKSSMKETNRVAIIRAVADLFEIKSPVPTSFSSIPVLNNQNATFYYFIGERGDRDIDDLWDLFRAALDYAKDPSDGNRRRLALFFDKTIQKKGKQDN